MKLWTGCKTLPCILLAASLFLVSEPLCARAAQSGFLDSAYHAAETEGNDKVRVDFSSTDEGYVLTDQTLQDLWEEEDDDEPIARRDAPARRIGTLESAALKCTGVQRVPVVLVSFSDKDFSVASYEESVRAYYEKFCNGTLDGNLYTGHGSHGSIRDYFVEQSDSVFFPEFTVIGPVKLDNTYAYYGHNEGSSRDVMFDTFRSHAIAKALQLQSDWSPFDNDGNGDVDMIFFRENTEGEYSGQEVRILFGRRRRRVLCVLVASVLLPQVAPTSFVPPSGTRIARRY